MIDTDEAAGVDPGGASLPPAEPTPAPTVKNRDAGRDARRSAPIHAYVGANGAGKSLAMVHDTLPSLQEGRRVLSTVRLLDPVSGDEHPAYERLTDWSQLLEAEHCDVLFDEVVGIATARASQGMPVQVQNFLVQLRRRDVVLRWTAPNWARADKIIREVTQAVTLCKGYLGKQAEGALWRQKRLFRFTTYDATEFEEFTIDRTLSTARTKISKRGRGWLWGPGSLAFASYDTLGQVERVGEILDGGRCAHCGGRRPIPMCSCDDAPKISSRRQVSLTAGSSGVSFDPDAPPAGA